MRRYLVMSGNQLGSMITEEEYTHTVLIIVGGMGVIWPASLCVVPGERWCWWAIVLRHMSESRAQEGGEAALVVMNASIVMVHL